MPGLIAVLAGGRGVYIEQFRGPERALGRAFPAHATALGKALLAEAPQAVLDELVLDPWTERTIVEPKVLASKIFRRDPKARLGDRGRRARRAPS